MPELPMFPLGSVLVPGDVLPLHVFEPRYRALVEDCLAGRREFGVVLIERGSEVGGGDVRTGVGTVAGIVEAARFADGRWALGCLGLRRIRVERWLDDDPYPRADVEPWPDPPAADDDRGRVDALWTRLRRLLALHAELGDPVAPAFGALADDPVLAAYQLVARSPFGPADRQALLGAPDLAVRLDRFDALVADAEDLARARLALAGDDPDFDPPVD